MKSPTSVHLIEKKNISKLRTYCQKQTEAILFLCRIDAICITDACHLRRQCDKTVNSSIFDIIFRAAKVGSFVFKRNQQNEYWSVKRILKEKKRRCLHALTTIFTRFNSITSFFQNIVKSCHRIGTRPRFKSNRNLYQVMRMSIGIFIQ